MSALVVCSCSENCDVRIACVGDSITEGMAIEWQADNSYPAQLDNLLGDGYEVINFGRSATTMMRTGDFPYWSAKEFSNVLRYHPDIIIIKLGTNDSKLFQWNAEAYKSSYQAMIDTFRSLVPKPEIKLCLPVPPQKVQWGITDSVVSTCVIPLIKELGTSNELEIIDLYDAIGHNPDLFVEDGIHPNKEGAAAIAATVYKHIKK